MKLCGYIDHNGTYTPSESDAYLWGVGLFAPSKLTTIFKTTRNLSTISHHLYWQIERYTLPVIQHTQGRAGYLELPIELTGQSTHPVE